MRDRAWPARASTDRRLSDPAEDGHGLPDQNRIVPVAANASDVRCGRQGRRVAERQAVPMAGPQFRGRVRRGWPDRCRTGRNSVDSQAGAAGQASGAGAGRDQPLGAAVARSVRRGARFGARPEVKGAARPAGPAGWRTELAAAGGGRKESGRGGAMPTGSVWREAARGAMARKALSAAGPTGPQAERSAVPRGDGWEPLVPAWAGATEWRGACSLRLRPRPSRPACGRPEGQRRAVAWRQVVRPGRVVRPTRVWLPRPSGRRTLRPRCVSGYRPFGAAAHDQAGDAARRCVAAELAPGVDKVRQADWLVAGARIRRVAADRVAHRAEAVGLRLFVPGARLRLFLRGTRLRPSCLDTRLRPSCLDTRLRPSCLDTRLRPSCLDTRLRPFCLDTRPRRVAPELLLPGGSGPRSRRRNSGGACRRCRRQSNWNASTPR